MLLQAKVSPGYNKTLSTKLYDNDRAYSDENKEKAKEYFKDHAGPTISGTPIWITRSPLPKTARSTGAITAQTVTLPADVHFDAIKDENTPVPGTISIWLNGYTTGKVSSTSSNTYNEGTQRGDFTWNDTNEKNTVYTENTFKSSKSVKGNKDGGSTQTAFATDKYYYLGDDVTGEVFAAPGIYETIDAEHKIVIETDETGEFTYTFYRPDIEAGYPLKLFGSGDAVYLRGKIGKLKKVDVYIVVTKGPYDGFLLTGYEVEYNDLNGKQTTSSSAPTVILPAATRFTDYDMHREIVDGIYALSIPMGRKHDTTVSPSPSTT